MGNNGNGATHKTNSIANTSEQMQYKAINSFSVPSPSLFFPVPLSRPPPVSRNLWSTRIKRTWFYAGRRSGSLSLLSSSAIIVMSRDTGIIAIEK